MLSAIARTVAIGVGEIRAGAKCGLVAVGQAICIRIRGAPNTELRGVVEVLLGEADHMTVRIGARGDTCVGA
jgi:hypothetical protein